MTCAFGTPWATCAAAPCDACRAETARLVAAFRADVAAGTYDAQGYTPAERKRREKQA